MILGTLTYPFTPTYAMKRRQLYGVGILWWDGSTVVYAGNPSRYHEVVFGGYEVYLKVFDWVWDGSRQTVQLNNWIEDLWAYAPGGSTPISFGTADVFASWVTDVRAWFYVVAFAPTSEQWTVQKMPDTIPGYWNPPNPIPRTYPYTFVI